MRHAPLGRRGSRSPRGRALRLARRGPVPRAPCASATRVVARDVMSVGADRLARLEREPLRLVDPALSTAAAPAALALAERAAVAPSARAGGSTRGAASPPARVARAPRRADRAARDRPRDSGADPASREELARLRRSAASASSKSPRRAARSPCDRRALGARDDAAARLGQLDRAVEQRLGLAVLDAARCGCRRAASAACASRSLRPAARASVEHLALVVARPRSGRPSHQRDAREDRRARRSGPRRPRASTSSSARSASARARAMSPSR